MTEIVRGTTPTLSFNLPFPVNTIASGYVTIQQRGKTAAEKKFNECNCDGNTLSVKLSQEDTLALKSGYGTGIRLVVKTVTGDRLETKDYPVQVLNTSKDEVI